MFMSDPDSSDVLVIGSGIAGLSLALRLADDMDVTVISKSRFPESNSYSAQGGISAVLGEDDSLDSRVRDTVDAGGGLCDPSVVRFVVERGLGLCGLASRSGCGRGYSGDRYLLPYCAQPGEVRRGRWGRRLRTRCWSVRWRS